jgi:hypothetical protein
MKRVNTRGMAGANKHVLMAALCYNLKKYLNFSRKTSQASLLAMQNRLGGVLSDDFVCRNVLARR